MASAPELHVGDEVSVHEKSCHIRFIGATNFADGLWVGIEFPSKIGRNDGSVEGERYFECPPRQGLFVRPELVFPIDQAARRETRDAPEDHVRAWAAMENVMEAEAIEAGLAGDRVLRHLRQLHPKGQSEPTTPNRRKSKSKHRQGEGSERKAVHTAASKQDIVGVTQPLDSPGSAAFVARLSAKYRSLPAGYTGPTFDDGFTPESMAALLKHVKHHVVACGDGVDRGAAVPAKVVVDMLLGARRWLDESSASLIELPLTEGRIVIVGDTHGQVSHPSDPCTIASTYHPEPPSAANHNPARSHPLTASLPVATLHGRIPLPSSLVVAHACASDPDCVASAQRLLLDPQGARPAEPREHLSHQWRRGRPRRVRRRDLSATLWVRAASPHTSCLITHRAPLCFTLPTALLHTPCRTPLTLVTSLPHRPCTSPIVPPHPAFPHRYMLACPGCVHINRGNHESFDMNIRGFHEGGGFAAEVGSKYDADVFSLFQVHAAPPTASHLLPPPLTFAHLRAPLLTFSRLRSASTPCRRSSTCSRSRRASTTRCS